MKIVFHGQNARAFRPDFETLLPGHHDITLLPDALNAQADTQTFSDADVIIGIKLDRSLPEPKRTKLYHAPAAGTDAIDPSCLPAGAALCNCHGHERAIAEYVIAALLLRHCPIPQADRDLRKGQWTYWWGFAEGARSELGSTSIGLLGFGHIGREIAARAKAFGMRVTVANRTPVATGPLVDASYPLTDIETFMGSADAIVVGLPLLPETTGFIGAEALASMRRTAVLVNVARGPIVDERALFDALSKKIIAGAIIDTWYRYPTPAEPSPFPATQPFHTLGNCTLTPHMSGWTRGTIRRRQETMADNIKRLIEGSPLVNRLNG
jgi:phosphoglycerate dehydrogenase-like enzyme